MNASLAVVHGHPRRLPACPARMHSKRRFQTNVYRNDTIHIDADRAPDIYNILIIEQIRSFRCATISAAAAADVRFCGWHEMLTNKPGTIVPPLMRTPTRVDTNGVSIANMLPEDSCTCSMNIADKSPLRAHLPSARSDLC